MSHWIDDTLSSNPTYYERQIEKYIVVLRRTKWRLISYRCQRRFRYWLFSYPAACLCKRPNKGLTESSPLVHLSYCTAYKFASQVGKGYKCITFYFLSFLPLRLAQMYDILCSRLWKAGSQSNSKVVKSSRNNLQKDVIILGDIHQKNFFIDTKTRRSFAGSALFFNGL